MKIRVYNKKTKKTEQYEGEYFFIGKMINIFEKKDDVFPKKQFLCSEYQFANAED